MDSERGDLVVVEHPCCCVCGSTNVTFHEYDFGTCRETGYRDAGTSFWCGDCGAMGDADDAMGDRRVEVTGDAA